jgi:hypothetical protein
LIQRKYQYYFWAGRHEGDRRVVVAESEPFWVTDPKRSSFVEGEHAHRALHTRLLDDGWELASAHYVSWFKKIYQRMRVS